MDNGTPKQNFTGSTMSRQFIINLTFKMGNTIAVSAQVTDWTIGGLGSGSLDPDETPGDSGGETGGGTGGGTGGETDPDNPGGSGGSTDVTP